MSSRPTPRDGLRRPGLRRPGRRSSFRRLLDAATDRYGLVMVLLLITYVLSSTLPAGGWSDPLLTAVQGVTVLVALAASDVGRRRRRRAGALAVLAVLIAAISAAIGGRSAGVTSVISAGLLMAALVAIIGRIAGHRQVSAQTLLGAICAYVLFGLIYTFVYTGVAKLGGGSFLAPAGSHSRSDYLFFSFTTLTTTGYGNLVPVTGLGRALAMLEALMGQLYLVTVLARLVAMWVPQRRAVSGAREDG